jgi:hypothetical protein
LGNKHDDWLQALLFFLTLAIERLLLDPRWRILLAIGFLGGISLAMPNAGEVIDFKDPAKLSCCAE